MVESAKRQKTPNERALELLLIGLTVIFIIVVVTLVPFAHYLNVSIPLAVLIALLVCLVPTTIGGLLPAIGIAGMERMLKNNVVALSGRGVEASGNVDLVLMDKTGTITLGNRMATEFIPGRKGPLKNIWLKQPCCLHWQTILRRDAVSWTCANRSWEFGAGISVRRKVRISFPSAPKTA